MSAATPLAESASLKFPPRSPASLPVNMNRLLNMANDDRVQLRELVGMYVKESGEAMRALKVAVQTGNRDQTERLAHRLGGTSAVCGMSGIAHPLHELEMAAKAGHRSFNEMLLREADQEHARVIEYLDGLGLNEVAQ